MLLGRVIGTLVPCRVSEGLTGTPMLWVQPLDRLEKAEGQPIVCADGTRMAGPGEIVADIHVSTVNAGEIVYWVESREAALTLDPWFVPVDHAIVGIVDEIKNDPPEKGAKIP